MGIKLFTSQCLGLACHPRMSYLRPALSDSQPRAEATGVGAAPSVYLREDPICGTQLENQSELRAPTAEKAAFYLDAALAARTAADEDEARSSHLLFTLNVYQYRIEKASTKAGLPGERTRGEEEEEKEALSAKL
ncbi:kinesin-like protein kif26a-like [Plakobranchus ocellatus]|uniref:Kinesin-like protein kif26a-like n=1 Tax=Plakobranchus ocellatus TaxID=259542 RepID=A0AAV4A0N3_9GAST|nr:kinesin-like protein kif26a-like [Plakobranchus ocellatus]